MRKKFNARLSGFIILSLILLLTSCNNNSKPVSNDESVSEASAESEASTTDVSSDNTTSETSVAEESTPISYTVTQKEIIIKPDTYIVYPYLQSDKADYSAVNALIKSRMDEAFIGGFVDADVKLNYDIKMSSGNILCIGLDLYYFENTTMPHPICTFIPLNIDLQDAKEFELTDTFTIDEGFIAAFRNSLDSVELPEAEQYLSELSDEELLSDLEYADFYMSGTKLGVSVFVPHMMHDYAIVEIEYDEIPHSNPPAFIEATDYTITENKVLINNNITIKYPEFSSETQDFFSLNMWVHMLAAELVDTNLDINLDGITANVDYQIAYMTDDIISIVFEGNTEVNSMNMTFPFHDIDTSNIDLSTENQLDLVEIYTVNKSFATKLKEAAAASDDENVKYILGSMTDTNLLEKLNEIDTYDSENCWYLTETGLGLSFEATRSMGDYVKFEIPYEEIEEFLK
ncbi:MAG: hypothetical protein A2Y17_01390 [Clostridiales bacterium GWF2_38_85]|nr:MAG: hypothetical protein A2Y17_01390 [Clostridiales bacterium GWF2_38_85]